MPNYEILTTKRRGFLFTMPLMLGMGILIFSSMIAISQLFVTIGGPMIPDLLADMPTIFHYTEDGQRVPEYLPLFTTEQINISTSENSSPISEKEYAESFPALAMYGLMVKIAFGIFVILLMFAGLSYFFEEFNIVRQGTAYDIIAKIIILVPIYFVLPYLWDMVALVIESSSLYLMDPFGGDPHGRTAELWCMIGSVSCTIGDTISIEPLAIFDNIGSFDRDTALSQDSWNNSLQSPLLGEGFIVNVLLSLFKGFSVMFMTAMMFVLSAVRVMLTEVIVISFPLVSAIGLIPWINTKRISDMFQQNLIGLSLAPIMSAIILSIGTSTIDSQNLPPLRMWFQLLSIGFLAIFFPVMLSPMLGNLSTKVGNMVSTSMMTATQAGSAGLQGMTRGITQASSMAKMPGGLSGMTGGREGGDSLGGFSSANVGTATSGANLGSTMSMLDKLKMYGTAGTIGMLSGLGSGMVDSTTKQMRLGGAAGDVSKNMMHAGDGHIGQIVQSTSISSLTRAATNQMIGIESSSINENSMPLEINNSTVMNPGGNLNTMIDDSQSFDMGQQLASDPAMKQEFANLYGQKMGLEEMSPQMHERFGEQIDEEINSHTTAAGKMFQNLKSGDV